MEATQSLNGKATRADDALGCPFTPSFLVPVLTPAPLHGRRSAVICDRVPTWLSVTAKCRRQTCYQLDDYGKAWWIQYGCKGSFGRKGPFLIEDNTKNCLFCEQSSDL